MFLVAEFSVLHFSMLKLSNFKVPDYKHPNFRVQSSKTFHLEVSISELQIAGFSASKLPIKRFSISQFPVVELAVSELPFPNFSVPTYFCSVTFSASFLDFYNFKMFHLDHQLFYARVQIPCNTSNACIFVNIVDQPPVYHLYGTNNRLQYEQ